jgi:ParB family chromosome partitioning protein
MTLDQLMAFTVNPDHERQEQVWEALQRSHNKEPYYVRRLLTEGAVRASDKRARFVGIEAYEAAGGDDHAVRFYIAFINGRLNHARIPMP